MKHQTQEQNYIYYYKLWQHCGSLNATIGKNVLLPLLSTSGTWLGGAEDASLNTISVALQQDKNHKEAREETEGKFGRVHWGR